MADRIPCVVPGCKRTHKPAEFSEWLCPKHWPMVPKRMRAAYSRAKRRRKDWPLLNRLWRRCKMAAMREAFQGWI